MIKTVLEVGIAAHVLSIFNFFSVYKTPFNVFGATRWELQNILNPLYGVGTIESTHLSKICMY